MIALDTETLPFEPGRQAPPLVCVSVSDGRLYHRTDRWQDVWYEGQTFVGHHMAFDASVMMTADPSLVPTIFHAYDTDKVTCTIIRAKLHDIALGQRRKSYALGEMVPGLDKESVRLRYGELWDTPVRAWPEAFKDYALTDARVTGELAAAQFPHPDEYRQARAALWIQLMSVWGLRTDQRAVQQLASSVEGQMAALAADLERAGLVRRDKKGKVVRNDKLNRERMAAFNGPMTAAGKPSVSKEACADSGDPDFERLAEYTGLQSFLSTDIRGEYGLLGRDIVHSRFDSLVDSGRTSSSKPNVQNKRRAPCLCDPDPGRACEPWCCGFSARECFVPRDGWWYVVADYAGAELCTLAQVCVTLLGHSTMADIINRDGPGAPHMLMTAAILGRDYEWCKANKKSPEVDMARQTAKIANFGFPGGLGAERMKFWAKSKYKVVRPVEFWRDLKALWLATFPEMRDYFALIGSAVELRGRVEQLFSGRVRGEVGYTDACNTMFQGLAADMAKDAGWRICKEEYLPGTALYGSRTVNFVHDEFVIESQDPFGAAPRVKACMLAASEVWCPDVRCDVDVQVMTRYSKTDRYVV